MIDFPGPECGILCINIVDLISRIALIGFSMLCASNYYYSEGPICYVLNFYSKYLYDKLSILFLFILS